MKTTMVKSRKKWAEFRKTDFEEGLSGKILF